MAERLQARFQELEQELFEKTFDRDSISRLYKLKGELIKLRDAVGQNEVVKRLAGWGAILAIPTVVFSMYGMNFKMMPELNQWFGYPLVVGTTFVACALLYRRLVRAGWI